MNKDKVPDLMGLLKPVSKKWKGIGQQMKFKQNVLLQKPSIRLFLHTLKSPRVKGQYTAKAKSTPNKG